MVNKHTGLFFALLLCTVAVQAQPVHGLQSALEAVRGNNSRLAAARQSVEARKIGARTGISPDDPAISADYLIGRPRSGGNQLDFLVVQAFDFPTVYGKQRKLADRQALLLDLEYAHLEKAVLLEAKQVGLRLIHLNKRKAMLTTRVADAQQVLTDYETKFRAQDVGALEVNRARIRLLGLQHALRQIEGDLAAGTQHLAALNGGTALSLTDTTYPDPEALPALAALETEVAAGDAETRYLRQMEQVGAQALQVTRARNLPRLEAGYHYQSVLGQTFNGVHLGASIPLWAQRNKVAAGRAEVRYQQQATGNRHLQVRQETRRLYALYEVQLRSLDSFRQALAGLNTKRLLRQSLQLGEIDFIRYAMELDYYYDALDQMLEIEHSLHLSIAQLLQHQL